MKHTIRITKTISLPVAALFGMVAGCSSDAASVGSASMQQAIGVGSAYDPVDRQINQDDFVSVRMGGGWGREKTVAPAANNPADLAGPQRVVQESDIYRLAGTLLYNLNAYRGLQIIDVSQTDRPKMLSRIDIWGQPYEMYVDPLRKRAHVLVNGSTSFDNLDLTEHARLVTIDLSRATPKVLGEVRIPGRIVESRQVGAVIYVVGSEWIEGTESTPGGSRTTVRSIYVGGNGAPPVVDQEEFFGDSYQIHASSRHLFIAQWAENDTHIRVLDISSPTGKIVRGGPIVAQGHLRDRHQMNMDTERGVLTVVTHHWDNQGSIFIRTIDVTSATQPKVLGNLVLDNIGTLLATRFDGQKAYLVHQVIIDPLDVIDLSDPSAPTRLSSLEIPGWLQDLEIRGNRVLGIGMDGQSVAVALYDVTDPRNTKEISRVSLGDGSSWQWASFWESRSFRFLDDKKLLLVPYQDGGKSLVRLVDVDLQAGKLAVRGRIEQRSEAHRSFSLGTSVGAVGEQALSIANVNDRDKPVITGSVELSRSINNIAKLPGRGYVQMVQEGWWWPNEPTELRAAALAEGADAELSNVVSRIAVPGAREMHTMGKYILTVSHSYADDKDTLKLQVIDYTDLRKPRMAGALALDATGTRTGFGQSQTLRETELLRVSPTGFLFVTETVAPEQAEGQTLQLWRTVHYLDLGNPNMPRMTSKEVIAVPQTRELLQMRVDEGALFMTEFESIPDPTPEQPEAQPSATNDEAQAKRFMPVWRPQLGRYYVTRVNPLRPTRLDVSEPINVPGIFLDIDEHGRMIVLDHRANKDPSFGRADIALDTLATNFHHGTASLRHLLDIDDGSSDTLVRDNHVYYTTSETANGQEGPMLMKRAWFPWYQRSNWTLRTAEVSGWTIRNKGNVLLQHNGAGSVLDVQDVGNKRYGFVRFSSSGIGLVDLTSAMNPRFSRFVQANGWNENMLVDPNAREAYFCSGPYGVRTVSLP